MTKYRLSKSAPGDAVSIQPRLSISFLTDRCFRFFICFMFFLIIGIPDGNIKEFDRQPFFPRRENVRSGQLLIKYSPRTAARNASTIAMLQSELDHPDIQSLEPVSSTPRHQSAIARRQGVQPLKDIYCLTLQHADDETEVLRKLGKLEGVIWAEPNYLVEVFSGDPESFLHSSGAWGQSYADQWALHDIQAPEAWEYSTGSDVLVAVIDTGVDIGHPELAGQLWVHQEEIANNGIDDDANGYIDDIHGVNVVRCEKQGQLGCTQEGRTTEHLQDPLGHGTHVAGIIAASNATDVGIAGVAPNAKLMVVRALGADGRGTVRDLSEGILYAVDQGADIINASWGGNFDSHILQEAILYAEEQGVLIVAAAGNDNNDIRSIVPAAFPSVFSVASSNRQQEKSEFSNWSVPYEYGPTIQAQIDVSAPGGGDRDERGRAAAANILSLRANNTDLFSGLSGYSAGSYSVGENGKFYRSYGTSMAAPFVTGVAALVLSKERQQGIQVQPQALRARLRHAVQPLNTDNPERFSGTGIINALQAVQMESRPAMRLIQDQVRESKGNGNAIPEAGEEAEITLLFESVWQEVDSFALEIATTDTRVSLQKSVATVSRQQGGQDFDNRNDPFRIQIHQIHGMTEIPATLRLTYQVDGVSYQENKSFVFYVGVKKISETVHVSVERELDDREPVFHGPKLHGSTVVWTDERHGNEDIYMYDLRTDKKTLLSSDDHGGSNPLSQRHASLSEDYVVWEDTTSGSPTVTFYDRTSGELQSLPASLLQTNEKPEYPVLFDGNLYFSVRGNESSILYQYSIDTGTLLARYEGATIRGPAQVSSYGIAVENDTHNALMVSEGHSRGVFKAISMPYLVHPREASLSGSSLVFAASSLDSTILYSSNLSNRKKKAGVQSLESASFLQRSPDHHERHLVWQDGRDYSWSVFYRNMETNYQERISLPSKQPHQSPAVSQSYIVWVSQSVLFARALPGSQGDRQVTKHPQGQRSPVIRSHWIGSQKNTLQLQIRAEDVADSRNDTDCRYQVYGTHRKGFRRALSDSLLLSLSGLSGHERFRIRAMPALRKASKRKRPGLALGAVCADGRSGLSAMHIVSASHSKKRGLSSARWLRVLRKRLLRTYRRHTPEH